MLDMKKALTKIMEAPIVVETGTTSNSRYRKWSDGTMELWMNYVGNVTFTGDRATHAFTLPVTFTSTPYMYATVNGDTDVYWSSVISCRYLSETSVSVVVERKTSTSGSYKIGISFYAIGKWK